MPRLIIFDNKFIDEETPIIPASNRGLRYGDGLFETIRMLNGDIKLLNRHLERLFRGLQLLQFDVPVQFTKIFLEEEIRKLCRRNNVEKAARIRLNIFRGNGGLFDPENLRPHYVIEATPLPDNYLRLNENGLILDVFEDVYKGCDSIANLKTNNYLPYVLAALYVKKIRVNDCFVLNQHHRICDSTIANVFWIHGDIVHTIPLSEGCVAGVMREYLLHTMQSAGYKTRESIASVADLENASEIFLTNAAYGIRWVKQLRKKAYSNKVISKIYNECIKTNLQ